MMWFKLFQRRMINLEEQWYLKKETTIEHQNSSKMLHSQGIKTLETQTAMDRKPSKLNLLFLTQTLTTFHLHYQIMSKR